MSLWKTKQMCQPILLTFFDLEAKVIFRTVLLLSLVDPAPTFLSLMPEPSAFQVEMYVPQDVKP